MIKSRNKTISDFLIWNLELVCYLELVIWNFLVLRTRYHRELPNLSAGYARLFGAYLRITTSSAGCTSIALSTPLTCMTYPRRQHSP